jgi:endoglucanase Acf2
MVGAIISRERSTKVPCLSAAEATVNTDAIVAETCLDKSKETFNTFLRNVLPYPLFDDEIYRGIRSLEGIARNDVNAEFGNTALNNHHFHYGVHIHRNGTSSDKIDHVLWPSSFPFSLVKSEILSAKFWPTGR